MTAGALILASPHPAPNKPDLLWAPVAGRPLLAWSVAACEATPGNASIVLLVPAERLDDARGLAASEGWARVRIIPGGEGMRASVEAGLRALAPALEWVVILDAARPLATPALLMAALDLARETGDDVITGEPVKETVKRVRDGLVVETLPRERMARAQTPYVFQRARLLAAHASLPPERDYSDEAALALAAGLPLRILPGSPENVRVTSAADLAVAAALLAAHSS
jgi:2-C-methyl-D-erythritol 4-phosphate cytidylyltransferase